MHGHIILYTRCSRLLLSRHRAVVVRSDIRAGRAERGIEQPSLRADDHSALSRKLWIISLARRMNVARLTEVGRRLAEEDLADELAGGVEHLHTIAAAGIDVARAVAVDAWDQWLLAVYV